MGEFFKIVGGGMRIVQFLVICCVILMSSSKLSDTANRNIIIFVFAIYYIHLNFVSSALQRDKNWSSVKCNPLQMIVESVVSEDSSSSFKKCLEYSYNEAVSTQIDKISKSNEAKLKNSQKQIKSLLKQPEDDNTTLQDLSGNIKELEDKLNENQPAIRQAESKLVDFNKWLSNFYTTFKHRDLIQNLKIQPDQETS